jgi:hypothetical protein
MIMPESNYGASMFCLRKENEAFGAEIAAQPGTAGIRRWRDYTYTSPRPVLPHRKEHFSVKPTNGFVSL